MSFINYMAREINCKLVYYGPGLCGKTTNLQYIYNKTKPEAKGKMISLATETERTLFFDFLPTVRTQWKDLRLRVGRSFLEDWKVPRRWALDAPSLLLVRVYVGRCPAPAKRAPRETGLVIRYD